MCVLYFLLSFFFIAQAYTGFIGYFKISFLFLSAFLNE